jgi:hypothetical protein
LTSSLRQQDGQIFVKVKDLDATASPAEPGSLPFMRRSERSVILNGEIKWRAEVVGIFPNKNAIVRLVGAILLEQNDEWAVQGACYSDAGNHRPVKR